MLTLTILAGGASTRMGQDKALLDNGSGALLLRLASLGLHCDLSVLVIGRLRPVDWPLPGVAFLPDQIAHQGPLGGLVTALTHTAPIILIACDLAALNEEALRWLIQTIAEKPLVDGLVVERDGHNEPLFACYTQRCLAPTQQRLQTGQRSLQRLISAGDFRHVELPPVLWPTLTNVNTPEEWQPFNLKTKLEYKLPPQNGKDAKGKQVFE
jgi:molybdenum cofactor guanylyltransferase